VAEISGELRLAPSTTHRFLRALIALGFVAQDDQTSAYEATLKLFNLGNMVIAKFNISERLLPVMRRVAEQVGESVSLVMMEGFEGVLLERVEGRQGVQVFTKYRRGPLYCTAGGKAILSAFDSPMLDKYLSCTPLVARTSFTLTTAEELKQELEKVRCDGYAVDNQELEVGAKCVGVPIGLANAHMAMSVSALAPRMTDQRIRDIAAVLRKTLAEAGFLGQLKRGAKSKGMGR
jgi:DNA-binding IclR family transcriptional regulator